MKNKLSHSAVSMYSTCGLKYKYHYVDKLRSKYIHGALLFGRALDLALNHLVQTKNLQESIDIYEKEYRFSLINNKLTYLPEANCIVYSERDFDYHLLDEFDIEKHAQLKAKLELPDTQTMQQESDYFKEKKKSVGFKNFEPIEKVIYNHINWLSMRQRGLIMLRDYNKFIIPKIKEVIAVQKALSLDNEEGDSIIGYIDLIVRWEDDKVYLLDNKTSYFEYAEDSAMQSQQLILYYHATKDEYKLDGVGFIVLYKALNKNTKKECSACKFDGTGGRHKTCNNEIEGKRCGAEWIVTIDPECYIKPILNQVTQAGEDLVLETFDVTNEGIKKENYAPNLASCTTNYGLCPYFRKCWYQDDSELIDMKQEKKDE